MTTNESGPNFALRDLAGLVLVLLLAAILIGTAFLTHAGPFILVALLIVLIFGLLRSFRERGRKSEAQEVVKALHTRLYRGEQLLEYTVGDRRRFKPLATLTDFALMMFTQGLAAQGSGALATDDTLIGLTNRRFIAIDRQKRPSGQGRTWRERLNLRREDRSKGQHTMIFESPREGLSLSVQLAVFYLARMTVRRSGGQPFSVGINSRHWAERAVALSKALAGAPQERD